MTLSTPVIFIIFNRPDLTAKVFEAIRKVQPQKLLIVADGARFDRPNEAEKCRESRAVIETLDWDCDVLKNYSDVNLGCGVRVATGLDWAFSQVEEAIVLEDDCLPAPSFFNFCEKMLEHYRDDERIMHISGDNSCNQNRTRDSYYYSKYGHIWGWATWRRAWQHYDYRMKSWTAFKQAGLLGLICEDSYEQKYWTNIFDQMYENPQVINTWDFQWLYTCWAQSGLAIAPNQNLVANLGFNQTSAAHTLGDDPRAGLATTDIWKIQHPLFMVRHREADIHTFDSIFGGEKLRQQDRLSARLRQHLSSAKYQLKSLLSIPYSDSAL
jgi:hypothetical protein